MRALPRILIGAAMMAALAMPLYAQDRRDRELFGAGGGDAEQSLTLGSNLGLTYFETLRGTPTTVFEQRAPDSSLFGNASGTLRYTINRKFLIADAAATAFSFYQPYQSRRWVRNYTTYGSASTQHEWQASRRTRVSLSQSVSFRPTYASTLVPGALSQGADLADPTLLLPPDVAALDGRMLWSSSQARLVHTLSRKATFDANYGFDRRWTFGGPEQFDFDLQSHRLGGGLTFALTRHLSLRTGYRLLDSRLGSADARHVREQGADVGLTYDRGGVLRLTRKTTLTFNVGATAIADSRRREHYLALGGARLDHEIGRTWTTSVGYLRHLDYSNLFEDPVLSDTALAEITGLLNRRLRFRSSAGYSRGTVGFLGVGHGVTRAYVLVELQSALSRYLGAGMNYTYYYRTIGALVLVRSDLAGRSESQALRVFLTARAPLLYRARRPNATR